MYEYACRIERVVDGDTLVVEIDLGFHIGMREYVRLADIDTPEIFGRNASEAGHRAKAFVDAWVAETSKPLLLVSESYDARGKYGRVIGTIYRDDDDVSLNAALKAAGHEK